MTNAWFPRVNVVHIPSILDYSLKYLHLAKNLPRFMGILREDPNDHFLKFVEYCIVNHIYDLSVRICMFPNALYGYASYWYISFTYHAIQGWG